MKTLFAVVIILTLSGCEILKPILPSEGNDFESSKASDSSIARYCESKETATRFKEFCSLDAWADTLILSSTIPWSERSKMINDLSSDPKSLIEKVLLSHGNDTPYIDRLRAQTWIEELQTLTDLRMTQVLDILIFQTNQQLLELESAITILSKVNGRQEKTMAAQQLQIEEKTQEIENQRQQVEQLLDIEASMVDQNRTDRK